MTRPHWQSQLGLGCGTLIGAAWHGLQLPVGLLVVVGGTLLVISFVKAMTE